MDASHLEGNMASQALQNLTTKERNDVVWDSMKAEIYQLLIVDGKTLQETRDIIKDKHGFSASERKWKMKRREWKFTTYFRSEDMRFMVDKGNKRLREENKETVLYYQGSLIEQRRLDNFKKKKPNPDDAVLDVATPAYITYHTPSAINSDDMEPRSTTAPKIPVESQTGIDPGASNSMERTLLQESHQPTASNGYTSTSGNDSNGALKMTLDSQLRRNEPIKSSDPSEPETPQAVLNATSSTTNEEHKFPLLRDLREESRMRDDHMASLERSRRAFHLHGDLQKFPRYVELPIQEEDLRFLKEVIESVRNNSVAEDYANLFPSEFLSRTSQTSEFWDEFKELIELVLVQWPSTPQDWHWSRFVELVLSCEAVFGLANCITVSLLCRYADFLVMVEFPFLAEDVLRNVIAKLPNSSPTLRLHCKLSLAAILFFTSYSGEAIKTLVSLIRTGLHSPRLTHPLFYAHLTRSSRLMKFIGPDISLSSESIVFSIIQVQRVVLQNYSGGLSLDKICINALVLGAHIAEKLSYRGSFSLADELFSSITTAITHFSNNLHGSKICTIYIALSSHHYRQNRLQEFRHDILNAYSSLSSDESLNFSTIAMLECMWPRFKDFSPLESISRKELEDIAEELRLIQADSEFGFDPLANIGANIDSHSPRELHNDELETTDLDDAVLVNDSIATTQSTTADERELIISIPLQGDSSWETYRIPERNWKGHGDTMTECTSNKYGVTFSVSEMTGISYSEFMVP